MITLAQASKVLSVVAQGLVRGLGSPIPGQMCVEAAVCYALGLPHGDDPKCVNEAVRSFKIKLNDLNWSSNRARAKGLRRLALAQLGSIEIDSAKFCTALAKLTIQKILPIALRSIKNQTPELEKIIERCEQEGSLEAAEAAEAASWAAKAAEANEAAEAASWAAKAAEAAEAASWAAKAAEATEAAEAAEAAAGRDEILTLSAELAIEALRQCEAPGIKLMDELCPL